MSSIQFDTAVFTQGLIGDRLKLFNRMRRMSEHHSDALSLGIIDGQGHRIRFLNDLSPRSGCSVAESIRNAIDSNKFDEALQLVAQQIKKGEVVFEKHSKGDDKTITAFAKKEVVDRIKSMKLHDKQSGKDVGYNEVAELQQDQLQQILEAAETILPETAQHKADKAAETKASATKEHAPPKATTPKLSEEAETSAEAPHIEDHDEARETLKALQKANIASDRKEEKKEEAKKEAEKIHEKELNREILKQEVLKQEIKHEAVAAEAEHKEDASEVEQLSEDLQKVSLDDTLEPIHEETATSETASPDDEKTKEESPKEVP